MARRRSTSVFCAVPMLSFPVLRPFPVLRGRREWPWDIPTAKTVPAPPGEERQPDQALAAASTAGLAPPLAWLHRWPGSTTGPAPPLARPHPLALPLAA